VFLFCVSVPALPRFFRKRPQQRRIRVEEVIRRGEDVAASGTGFLEALPHCLPCFFRRAIQEIMELIEAADHARAVADA